MDRKVRKLKRDRLKRFVCLVEGAQLEALDAEVEALNRALDVGRPLNRQDVIRAALDAWLERGPEARRE